MTKVKKTLTGVISLASAFLASATTVLAATEGGGSSTVPTIDLRPSGYETITQQLSVSSLISGGIKLILVVAAILFFFMLVIGGIQWIMSGGDKAGSENARKRITSALVGLAIVFAAWAIASLIKALFGIDIFTFSIPTLYNTGQ